MTQKSTQPVSADEFDAVVDFLEERARKFFHRESQVGHSTRVTGNARIKDEELHPRLARLRDYLKNHISELRQFLDAYPKLDHGTLTPNLGVAEQEIDLERFANLTKAKLLGRLRSLLAALDGILEHLDIEIAHYAKLIEPDIPLELLTPDELLNAFGEVPEATILARFVSVKYDIRYARDEVMALLKGRYYFSAGKMGQYQKQRGRWITAHLVGLAEGLGLRPSRNNSPSQHSDLRSAADAVAIVIGRLRFGLLTYGDQKQGFEDWLDDPAVRAVLAQMPMNRGDKINVQAVADNIARNFVNSKEEFIVNTKQVGKSIGRNHAKGR